VTMQVQAGNARAVFLGLHQRPDSPARNTLRSGSGSSSQDGVVLPAQAGQWIGSSNSTLPAGASPLPGNASVALLWPPVIETGKAEEVEVYMSVEDWLSVDTDAEASASTEPPASTEDMARESDSTPAVRALVLHGTQVLTDITVQQLGADRSLR